MSDNNDSDNPYRSPAALKAAPAGPSRSITRKIQIAWVAGIAVTIWQCIAVALKIWEAWSKGIYPPSLGSHVYIPMVGIALTAALTYGIYRNSRLCASVMLTFNLLILTIGLPATASDINDVYAMFPASTQQEHLINVFMKEGPLLLVASTLSCLFGLGVMGTFALHRNGKKAAGS